MSAPGREADDWSWEVRFQPRAESEGSGVAKAAEVAVQLLGTVCADLLAEPYMQWQLTQQVD